MSKGRLGPPSAGAEAAAPGLGKNFNLKIVEEKGTNFQNLDNIYSFLGFKGEVPRFRKKFFSKIKIYCFVDRGSEKISKKSLRKIPENMLEN